METEIIDLFLTQVLVAVTSPKYTWGRISAMPRSWVFMFMQFQVLPDPPFDFLRDPMGYLIVCKIAFYHAHQTCGMWKEQSWVVSSLLCDATPWPYLKGSRAEDWTRLRATIVCHYRRCRHRRI